MTSSPRTASPRADLAATGAPMSAAGTTPRHARARRVHRWGRAVAMGVVAVLTAAVAGTGALAWQLHSNVTTLPSVAELVGPRPGAGEDAAQSTADDPWPGRAVNVLLMGSDDRSGVNGDIGGPADGMRSDTTLLVHVSADRSRVEAVSIPRDSRAQIPACHLDWSVDGAVSRPQVGKFNAAFAIGANTSDLALAAACTISTVQSMTGVSVDGFAIVDFAGFQSMVDAVGGVRVCLPEPLVDGKYTSLNLEAGWHDLAGDDALDFVRARHVKGTDGTDLSRIDRQQQFLGALVRKVTSSQVLTSPASLISFMSAATSSLTVSAELDSRNAAGLVWSARGVRPADVTFVTVPWQYGSDGYVEWTKDADELWARLIADTPIVDPAPAPAELEAAPGPAGDVTPGAPAPSEPAPTPAQAPLDIPVRTGEDPQESICG